MAQLLDFLAGDLDTLSRACSGGGHRPERDADAALLALDFSLHLTPIDLDALTAAARDAVGGGPVSLTGCLGAHIGGDGVESSADLIDREWVALWAALQSELLPAVVQRWRRGPVEGQEEVLQAVLGLHEFCRQALARNLAVMLSWSS